ncbi:LOW QUALITY PROTEIN: hypothetical protein TorRG33x02_156730 [Trema orientale]|uniref:Uncharacterized protein n=1 Tax=Trema orientale TaxID=63057 RepID=A0A2P5ESU0_TREOI|nr:LOW QUALITY PROTEIN: hypothetical protein TorRG33x02_156730 [Trema orientale]
MTSGGSKGPNGARNGNGVDRGQFFNYRPHPRRRPIIISYPLHHSFICVTVRGITNG